MSKTKRESIGQKKEWAKTLFLKENRQQNEIAAIVRVSEKTVSKWKKEGNWDALRETLSQTKEEQLKSLYAQLKEINTLIKTRAEGERFANNKEADIISKLSKAIKELESDVNVVDIIDTSIVMLNWLRVRDYAKAQEVAGYFDQLINEMINK